MRARSRFKLWTWSVLLPRDFVFESRRAVPSRRDAVPGGYLRDAALLRHRALRLRRLSVPRQVLHGRQLLRPMRVRHSRLLLCFCFLTVILIEPLGRWRSPQIFWSPVGQRSVVASMIRRRRLAQCRGSSRRLLLLFPTPPPCEPTAGARARQSLQRERKASQIIFQRACASAPLRRRGRGEALCAGWHPFEGAARRPALSHIHLISERERDPASSSSSS
jgi:hypothetical protein